jgi:hypothetical protein
VDFQGVSQATQGAVSGFFVAPPDTVGDVGPNHYVQCVNLACQVFSKAGAPLSAVFTLRSLFVPLGGQCAVTNDGDPIVNYDPLADRWMLSQFSVANRPPAHECIAISQTADPTGAWFLYDFVIPNDYFNDYPKLGVWPDAYYMTAPLFEGPAFGQGIFAMNRSKMLAGDPGAEMIFFDLTVSNPTLHRVLPADVDGPAPPPGTPNYMAGIAAEELGDLQDGIRLFELTVDWSSPLDSTLTEIPFPGGSLAVAAFDPTFTEVSGNCGFAFTSRDDLEQPAPANCGMRVDALSDRPLHRLAYRNFGSHESLVFTHTVDVNATAPTAPSGHLAGVRYYELRRTLPGGSFTVQEQATYSPDATHRWMGSAAMDAAGNLAVGYSVSDAATFPGVRYAGRLAGDPPGGLFQGEALLEAGGRSQTSTGSRWGDYSALSVDPADDCTFWYTQEYYDATAPPACSATACWTTRISAFTYPGCAASNLSGTLHGTVSDASSSAPISGALVQANGYATWTNGTGDYTFLVPPGTYDVTAYKAGYSHGFSPGAVVTNGGITIRNFVLGQGSIAGVVTDAVTNATISGATVQIVPGPTVFTNGSGAYSAFLPAGSYAVNVSAPGHFGDSASGIVVNNTGATVHDAALDPAPELEVTAIVVDDSVLGNATGGADPNECFTLQITLTNAGAQGLTAIDAVLSSADPEVTVTGGWSSYPNLAAAASADNDVPFEVSFGSIAVDQNVELTLTVTTSLGTINVPVSITPGAASLTTPAIGPVAIPDNQGSGANLDIPVAGFPGTLTKLLVKARISHTYSGDLILRVVSPDLTVVYLAYQVGGAGAGFGAGSCPAASFTVFDDDAATFINDGTAPFVGSFRPLESLSAYNGMSGVDVNGTWKFQVVDLGPADVGNIECVELVMNDVTVATACNTLFHDGFETGNTLRWSGVVP